MMHLEYKRQEYKGCRIDIQPGSEREIPGLRDMIFQNMIIVNPAKTFAEKMKTGGYEGWSEDEIVLEAEVANELSDLWDGEPVMNVMMLLSRSLQMVANLKLNKDALKPYEDFPKN